MKKSKRIINYFFICMLGVLTFYVGISSPKALSHDFTNYYGITITRDEYATLLNLGFSNDEIYYMTEDIFNENKDLSATLLSRNQKYYKTVYPTYGNSYTVEVTEDEYYNHDNTSIQGLIETNYKTIVSTISSVNSTTSRFKVTESWSNIPSTKSYDVIGIGFDGNIHINNVITFNYTYYVSSGAYYTESTYFYKLYSETGGSTTFKLPNSFVGLSSMMYYNVVKDTGANVSSLYMCGDYAHATTSVTGNQAASHGIGIGGIDFSSSVVNKFDETPCAYSTANVSW